MKIFSAPILIHCWGGLGSQLFTLSLAEDLSKILPNRKIELVFHTGGVTSRDMELNFIPRNFNCTIVDDYRDDIGSSKKLISDFYFLRKIIKMLLKSTAILATANDDSEFDKIKPWVLEIRGHYSDRTISEPTLKRIYTYFSNTPLDLGYQPELPNNLGLHYRLGDLVEKNIKSYISGESISRLIKGNALISNCKIDIFSDSPDKAVKILESNGLVNYYSDTDSKSFDIICKLTQYKFFIGTNSKITIWVVVFRLAIDINSYNFIPKQIESQIRKNVFNIAMANNLIFY